MARTLRRIAFWTGIVAAALMPLVPFIYTWLYPPKPVREEPGVAGLVVMAFDLLGTLGHGINMLLWMAALAAVAVLATLIAFGLAWYAREPRRTKLLCWLPVLLVGLGYGVLVAIEG